MTTPAAGAPAAGTAAPAGAGAAPTTLLGGDAAPAAPAAGAGGAPAAAAGAGAPPPPAAAAGADPAKAAAEAAAAAAAAASEVVIKLPDGFKGDMPTLGKFKEWAKTNGVKSEQAQALFDMQLQANKAQHAQLQADRVQQTKEWEAELKADPAFGGAKFDENVQLTRKGILNLSRLAGVDAGEVKKLFADHPLGNHPLLAKVFAAAGKAIGEDVLAGINPEGGQLPANNKQALHKQMYPKSYEQMNGRR